MTCHSNEVRAVPKPTYKKQRRAVNNPPPTAEDICRWHETPYAETHEIYEGNGRRQISIKYGAQVKVCRMCHREIQLHPLQGKDLMLKQEFQQKFEAEGHSRDEFIKLFSCNYL